MKYFVGHFRHLPVEHPLGPFKQGDVIQQRNCVLGVSSADACLYSVQLRPHNRVLQCVGLAERLTAYLEMGRVKHEAGTRV